VGLAFQSKAKEDKGIAIVGAKWGRHDLWVPDQQGVQSVYRAERGTQPV
jgi:hypothetical protein